MYLALKHFHITCVVLSGAGFALRGAWALAGSPLARARLTRVLPHVVDSCLLLSAIALAWMAGQYPFVHGWLTAKIVGLLAYIGAWVLVPEEGTNDEPLGLDQRSRTLALAGVGSLFWLVHGRPPLLDRIEAHARELEALMLDHGADGPSFETIVAAGANSAVPHHRPTDAVLEAGDFVMIDFGALVGGYHSDMTRTFVLGSAAAWQRELYQLVAAAQLAGREALAVGATLSDVDAAAREVIAAAGHAARTRGTRWTLPVCFDPDCAPDLDDVAAARGLTREAVIALRDRGIDPVGEAEVFLAYGKVSEAVRVLKATVREEPDNLPAKITLLRAYSHSGDSKAYSLLARDVESRLQGQPVWKTIQQHGRELDPTNPLFNR